jgi:FMN-dependent NADH-azoreductase
MTKTILHIDSSPMGDRSVTRKLTKNLVAQLVAKESDTRVIYHDLSTEVIPHLDGATLGAFFTPVADRTSEQAQLVQLSDQLTDELLGADIIVIAAPMWNFNIPSSLKAWLDHVSRVGKTFKYTETGPQGLVSPDKQVVIVSSSGGIYSDGPAKSVDFQVPYLIAFLAFLGITNVSVARAEGVAMGPDAAANAVQSAEEQLAQIVASLR